MKNLMVLVVDDNLVSRLLPSFILRPYSGQVQVVECESGVDALRLIEMHHVTHVLLDISMPEIDGIEVARVMKHTSKFPSVQLIAYTADALMANDELLRSKGFDSVLLKPLRSESLLAVLGIKNQEPC